MMLRDAVNEIRLHPGRFVATLLAIAISVGFISAILVGVRTEGNSVANASVLQVSKADVVVSGSAEDPKRVESIIRGAAGVTAADAAAFTTDPLTHGDASVIFNVMSLPSEEFRWANLAEGAWPSSPSEITLSKDGARKLGVSVGDQLTVDVGASKGGKFTVVGLTNDAPTLYASTAYLAPSGDDMAATLWAVKSSDPQGTVKAIDQALNDAGIGGFKVMSLADYRTEVLNGMTGRFDVFRNLLLGFAGIALVVGMIIIANTFTILVTQRRRQIGLLRAVGASTGQVAGRLLIEAIVLGLIGSLLGVLIGAGVGVIIGQLTGSLYWGLVMPLGELVWAVLAGVIATVVSVLGPSLKATRVKPLEALQVVPSAAESKRLGAVRAVFCVLFLLAGGLAIFRAFSSPENSLVWAMVGGVPLSVGLLLAAPFYVPWLLRLFGRLFGFAGPTVRLAAKNAARNPRRASATAVALMLAVGLVVTLQVAASTVRSTAMEAINDRYPVDISLQAREGAIDAKFEEQMRSMEGITSVVEVPSKEVQVEGQILSVRNVNAARAELGLSTSRNVPDGVLMVSTGVLTSATVDLPGAEKLKVQTNREVPYGSAAVSESTYERLTGAEEVRELWLKMSDRTSWTDLNRVIKAVEPVKDKIEMSGAASMAGLVTEIVNVTLMVLTGLLGVAVVIALVGVGNTLGLSVLERQRESALLRALGMQRSSLRMMLLVEAMLLALVGILVGIAAGAGFGWLGVVTAVRMMPANLGVQPVFSIDLPYTGGLILICVLAASLASVLPGRRAANATPTEALAAE